MSKLMGDPSFGKCTIRIMSNDILQVNGVYLQRRRKFLATINTINNARKRYKKNKQTNFKIFPDRSSPNKIVIGQIPARQSNS